MEQCGKDVLAFRNHDGLGQVIPCIIGIEQCREPNDQTIKSGKGEVFNHDSVVVGGVVGVLAGKVVVIVVVDGVMLGQAGVEFATSSCGKWSKWGFRCL